MLGMAMSDGIAPGRCFKCRRKSQITYLWSICSDGPDRRVCELCDLVLNQIALKWAYPKTWRAKYRAYKKRQGL